MPLPTESLRPDSSREEIQRAISAAISQCVSEGRDQDQCVAIAHETARRATRSGSGNSPTRQIRAGLGDRERQ